MEKGSSGRPDRKSKRLLGVHVDETLHRDVKVLAAKRGTTVNALMHEAIALLFDKDMNRPGPAL